jgi:hypothetical protein
MVMDDNANRDSISISQYVVLDALSLHTELKHVFIASIGMPLPAEVKKGYIIA